jgi:hypothetical protein
MFVEIHSLTLGLIRLLLDLVQTVICFERVLEGERVDLDEVA